LCTGLCYSFPECLQPLASRIPRKDGNLIVREDYSIKWDGPEGCNIYVQNAARHCRGIADPNLSLMAWRSGIIVNSLAGRCVYNVHETSSLIEWDLMQENWRGAKGTYGPNHHQRSKVELPSG
jgi:lysine N6-hydroxylase